METEFSVVFFLVRCVRNFDIRLVLTGDLTYGGKRWQVIDVLDMIYIFSLEPALGDTDPNQALKAKDLFLSSLQ